MLPLNDAPKGECLVAPNQRAEATHWDYRFDQAGTG